MLLSLPHRQHLSSPSSLSRHPSPLLRALMHSRMLRLRQPPHSPVSLPPHPSPVLLSLGPRSPVSPARQPMRRAHRIRR